MENTTTQTTTLTTEGNTAPVTDTALVQEEIEEEAVDTGEGDAGAVLQVETTPVADEGADASTLLLGGAGIFVGLLLLLVVARKFVDWYEFLVLNGGRGRLARV